MNLIVGHVEDGLDAVRAALASGSADAARLEQESAQSVAAISARLQGRGAGSWLGGMALKRVASALGRLGGRESPPIRHAPPARNIDIAALDRAANIAQTFAEHLVAGNFEAAQALLADPRHLSAGALRESYTAMTDYGDEVDDDVAENDVASVLVITCDADRPDLGPDDIGWVYVAISGGIFNEAVTVVVTDEQGEARIRELEWGRP